MSYLSASTNWFSTCDDVSMRADEVDESELAINMMEEPPIAINDCLPLEIVTMVFKYLDCKSLTKAAMTNKFWYELLNSKDIQKSFKNECMELFDNRHMYAATKKYLVQFEDWKNMFIFRPRVRCDGIYFADVKYWHDGLTEFGDYNPIHMIKYYVFLQFSSDGKMIYAQTSLEPEIFLEKLGRKKIKVDEGIYYIKNRTINIEIQKGRQAFCHTYRMEGKVNAPSDNFVLTSKYILDVESQTCSTLREKNHGKAVFEFTKTKQNYMPK